MVNVQVKMLVGINQQVRIRDMLAVKNVLMEIIQLVNHHLEVLHQENPHRIVLETNSLEIKALGIRRTIIDKVVQNNYF